MKQLFISDLHLKDLNTLTTQAFFAFLDQKAALADELYILGDFFEYWIGDDAISELSHNVATHLKNLKEKHKTDLYFMVGNRDFLVGKSYCEQAGMRLIEEPYKLPGTSILLCHGDAECTTDTEYQKVRQVLRSPQWQQDFLNKTLEERTAFAEQARAQSKEHQAGYELTDLNDDAVNALLEANQADVLIHGHTHKPGIRAVAEQGHKRVTLSDWDHEIWYAEIKDSGTPELCQFTHIT
ncbi:UDP-2,3-diacylglucosamine diphosphatase [Oceanospirillum sp.]|uniref:UDP-2,3-diacylglucosamine diphosphatase n=1 Tax=Oceanospirillum sp. TaxID=2021254 RepID=UPI003A8D8779